MFERYDDAARRALFFARYVVTQLGGETIEPATAEAIRLRVEAAVAAGTPVATSVEIPFSDAAKAALEAAASEANDLRNQTIRPEHIVLGVMAAAHGAAARILVESGVDVGLVRGYLRGLPDEARRAFDGPYAVADISREPREGMIVRQWKGVARPSQADAYVAHLRRETFPALSRLPGFVTVTLLRRDVEDGIEFQVTTVWHSRAAIEAFAGADISVAVVPPAAQALLLRYDRSAVHYEIV